MKKQYFVPELNLKTINETKVMASTGKDVEINVAEVTEVQ